MVTSGDPELRPASVPAPPQGTSELQAPPSPKNHQKPRASHLRQESADQVAPDPGIEFLQTPGRTPAFGSPLEGTPLEGTPVPRYGVFQARCVLPGFLCWRSRSEAYNGSSSTIPLGDFSDENVARLPVLVVYDEYQKAKAWKRHLSYTPPPRLTRALYRLMVQDMMARRDLLVQQVKALARWELMKEWLERRVDHWNPEEEYRRHLFLSGGLNHQSGSFSQAVTPRSVVGSRFSEGPSF
ncbi:hypothetical protein HID58_074073 [Brassica napus]|uniref:Uncharacterized protein n=1 Tax=Brassica napus TaxID=3708 RepID=A0ABQ7YFN2_BRANA|nr:hypothetical protein HID58_074073 [Brassica napus]